MFNSEMIAVGKSPVKSERATSCVSSQRASEGKRSCNDCSDRRPMRRLIGMTQMMVKAQMIPFSSVWRRMSDERDTNTIRCQCKSRFSVPSWRAVQTPCRAGDGGGGSIPSRPVRVERPTRARR